MCSLRLRHDRRQILTGFSSALSAGLAAAHGSAPVFAQAAPPETLPAFDDRVVTDPATRRRIGVRLRFPASEAPAPLIVYSPGLGSGLSNGASWCEAWRQAGFVVATMNHPVTGDAVFAGSEPDLDVGRLLPGFQHGLHFGRQVVRSEDLGSEGPRDRGLGAPPRPGRQPSRGHAEAGVVATRRGEGPGYQRDQAARNLAR